MSSIERSADGEKTTAETENEKPTYEDKQQKEWEESQVASSTNKSLKAIEIDSSVDENDSESDQHEYLDRSYERLHEYLGISSSGPVVRSNRSVSYCEGLNREEEDISFVAGKRNSFDQHVPGTPIGFNLSNSYGEHLLPGDKHTRKLMSSYLEGLAKMIANEGTDSCSDNSEKNFYTQPDSSQDSSQVQKSSVGRPRWFRDHYDDMMNARRRSLDQTSTLNIEFDRMEKRKHETQLTKKVSSLSISELGQKTVQGSKLGFSAASTIGSDHEKTHFRSGCSGETFSANQGVSDIRENIIKKQNHSHFHSGTDALTTNSSSVLQASTKDFTESNNCIDCMKLLEVELQLTPSQLRRLEWLLQNKVIWLSILKTYQPNSHIKSEELSVSASKTTKKGDTEAHVPESIVQTNELEQSKVFKNETNGTNIHKEHQFDDFDAIREEVEQGNLEELLKCLEDVNYIEKILHFSSNDVEMSETTKIWSSHLEDITKNIDAILHTSFDQLQPSVFGSLISAAFNIPNLLPKQAEIGQFDTDQSSSSKQSPKENSVENKIKELKKEAENNPIPSTVMDEDNFDPMRNNSFSNEQSIPDPLISHLEEKKDKQKSLLLEQNLQLNETKSSFSETAGVSQTVDHIEDDKEEFDSDEQILADEKAMAVKFDNFSQLDQNDFVENKVTAPHNSIVAGTSSLEQCDAPQNEIGSVEENLFSTNTLKGLQDEKEKFPSVKAKPEFDGSNVIKNETDENFHERKSSISDSNETAEDVTEESSLSRANKEQLFSEHSISDPNKTAEDITMEHSFSLAENADSTFERKKETPKIPPAVHSASHESKNERPVSREKNPSSTEGERGFKQPLGSKEIESSPTPTDSLLPTKNPVTSKGLVVVFNYIFNNQEDPWFREGAEKDSDNLESHFKRLGFEVIIKEDRTKNKTLVDIKRTIGKLAEGRDSLLFFFLSHGEIKGRDSHFITYDKKVIYFRDILKLFTDAQCRTMVGKPKVIFTNLAHGLNVEIKDNKSPSVSSKKSSAVEYPVNVGVIYSSVLATNDHAEGGTVFGTCLCDVLEDLNEFQDLNEVVYLLGQKMRQSEKSSTISFDYTLFPKFHLKNPIMA